MRIIALKLKQPTRVLLRDVAKTHAQRDTGFVEDLYSLMRLRGKGIPTPTRIKKMCDAVGKKIKIPPMTLSFQANKRALLFKQIVMMPYFKALSKTPNTINATARFIVFFKKLHNKVRQAQCLTCPLMSQCDFGQQYGGAFVDITLVIDPDYDKKAHPDCPELPQISTVNQIAVATKQMHDLAVMSSTPQGQLAQLPPEAQKVQAAKEKADKEDAEAEADDNLDDELDEEDFGHEDDLIVSPAMRTAGGSLDTGDTGGFSGNIVNITEKMIDTLTNANLNIFELGRKFGLALQQGKKNKFAPTTKLDRKQAEKHMESVSDISKIIPSQHALPKEAFDAKADKKQLRVKQNMQRQTERRLLYLMVDNSISMGGQFPGAAHLMCSRGIMASVLGIALARHVLSEGGIVYLRFFATSVSALFTAENMDEFPVVENVLAKASYTGSGTRILRALSAAVEDIENGKAKNQNIGKADILVVTDCEDSSLTVDSVKGIVKDLEFNVLDVAGHSYDSPVFKATAKKYYKADETQMDVNKIVSVV